MTCGSGKSIEVSPRGGNIYSRSIVGRELPARVACGPPDRVPGRSCGDKSTGGVLRYVSKYCSHFVSIARYYNDVTICTPFHFINVLRSVYNILRSILLPFFIPFLLAFCFSAGRKSKFAEHWIYVYLYY